MIGYRKKETRYMIKSVKICDLPSADGIRSAIAVVPGRVITPKNMKSKTIEGIGLEK